MTTSVDAATPAVPLLAFERSDLDRTRPQHSKRGILTIKYPVGPLGLVCVVYHAYCGTYGMFQSR
jgi:hypothetical protein